MHDSNRLWLEELSQIYFDEFSTGSILEIGSLNINGSARRHFSQQCRYVGVDKVVGPSVDVVSKAQETLFEPDEFDVLLILSVFEHDPDWANCLRHNLKWIRTGGLVILCWGAEGNLEHEPAPWAPVPILDFLRAIRTMPMGLIDHFAEEERYTQERIGVFKPCAGAYYALGRKI